MYFLQEVWCSLTCFTSYFSNKRRFEQIYKNSLQDETVSKLQKEEVVGKCSVKKMFLKTS